MTPKKHTRKQPGRSRLAAALRWLLAAVLVWAGLTKLVDPASFYGAMVEYQLPLPHALLKLTAVILPWMELFCGLLLVTGIARQATLVWVNALFAVFLVMVGQAFLRGIDVSCGCFNLERLGLHEGSGLGRFLESAGFATLRNVALLGAAVFLWKRSAAGEAAPNPNPS